MRTMPGWSPPPPQDWSAMPSTPAAGRRLVWPLLLLGGLLVVLAIMAGRDGTPGLGLRAYLALAVAAALAWRLTVARSLGPGALFRTAAEWLAVVGLAALLAAPAALPREAPTGRPPAKVKAVERARQAAEQDGGSGLVNLLRTFHDAWEEARRQGAPSPTDQKE